MLTFISLKASLSCVSDDKSTTLDALLSSWAPPLLSPLAIERKLTTMPIVEKLSVEVFNSACKVLFGADLTGKVTHFWYKPGSVECLNAVMDFHGLEKLLLNKLLFGGNLGLDAELQAVSTQHDFIWRSNFLTFYINSGWKVAIPELSSLLIPIANYPDFSIAYG